MTCSRISTGSVYRTAHGRAAQLDRRRLAALGDAVCVQQAEAALMGLLCAEEKKRLPKQITFWY